MVNDAEKFKAEDEAQAAKVGAKNDLENYCFQMKNTMNDEKIKDSFTNEDKKAIEEISAEGLQWLDGNQEADGDAMAGKKKELEAKFNPIMMRVYQEAGVNPNTMPGAGDMPQGGAEPPKDAGVDDLD